MGAREASGRRSRRISTQEKQFRAAQAYWRSLVVCAGRHTLRIFDGGEPHPILKLVNLDKIDPESFIIALYWVCTDFAVAPNWSERDYLAKITGFDFCKAQGCRAARSFAAEHLSPERVANLDDAALRGHFRTDAAMLKTDLHALWELWCGHGARRTQSLQRARS